MIGKFSLIPVILALTLAPASYLGAAQKQPQPGELPYTVQGTITHVNSKKDDVTIQTNNGEETFPVDSDTTIRVNGSKAKIRNLEAGQQANMRIEDERAVRVDASDPAASRTGSAFR